MTWHNARLMRKGATGVSSVPLPEGWSETVQHGVATAINLAWHSLCYVNGWAINSPIERLQLKGENARLRAKCGALEEENRIIKARLSRVPARERPYYTPEERLQILLLRASQGWSAAQTARRFLVSPGTVASWMKRLQEGGESALLRLASPVNKFGTW